MLVLVAHGSTRGGTEGIARMVGEALAARGLDVDVLPARRAPSPDGYDAVVVGGSLTAGRWHRDARRFVRRWTASLRRRPVWCFSSGPLDGSATGGIPPTRGVQQLMDLIGARGHATFGGYLAPDTRGFPARFMARTHAGDWRDPAQVARWAEGLADQLATPVPPA